MDLTGLAVDRPRIVIVFTALILILAIVAMFLIPVQRTPAINTAIVTIAVPFPGSQPTEVEDQITRKIEDALQRLNNVDFIASTSMRGSSVTQIIFLDGQDSDEARNDVEHLVNEVRRELPMGREVQPIINVIDFESAPIMLVTLSGPPGFDERTLKQIAEDAQDELETVSGVANTQLFGGREREIHVTFNPDLLAAYNLTINDMRDALSGFHAEMPGGSLNSSEFDLQLRSETKFRGVADIEKAVVAEREGRLIRIEDVAEVEDTYRRLINFAQLDGENSATIIVNKEANINTLAAARDIKERVAQLREQFPFIKFSCTRDISADIGQMFNMLGSDAIFGTMVVLLILAWSMGMRIGLLVITAVPVSSAVALVFLYFGGYAVSNMVIFSFIVALGMVIDGAIIVSDAIYRRLERGESPKEAAKNGAHEVAIPVFAADMTTIAAFVPMLLVPGIMGDFMGVLPVVVSMSLAGSLIVDHFLVPVLAAWWFRDFDVTQVKSAHGSSTSDRIERIWAPFYRAYNAVLGWALKNRAAVMGTCACLVAWAACMLIFGFIGFIFFPPSDRGQFEVSFEMPLGYSIEETTKAAEAITEPLREMQKSGEIVHFVTAIGSTSGLASRLDSDPAAGPEFGRVMVELTAATTRKRHENEIIAELRKRIKVLPGMKYRIDQVEEGPPGGADVAVRFSGKNLEQLGRIGRQLQEELQRQHGTVEARSDYRPDNPEIVIEPHPEVVGLFQMTEAEVARAIQTAILGDTTIELSLDNEDVTLRLQADREHQQHVDDIANLMITSPKGRRATVGELADVRRGGGLFSVNRRDRRRAVVVSCDIDKQSDVIPNDIFAKLRSTILPNLGFHPVKGNSMAFLGTPNSDAEGVRATFTGENEEQAKGFNSLLRSMIIGVVLIAGILVIEFNSFRLAAIVMATVPLSFVGCVFGMWWCGFAFSLSVFIGLISLTGVVVNDAIVLVDFANEARARGLPLEESLLEAGNKRARAVMLTMLTSVGGMLPTFYNITGGGEFWIPLTGAIIFGLAFSATLTLIVIPVAYSLAYGGSERRRLARLTLDAANAEQVVLIPVAEPGSNGDAHTAHPLPALT
jgi:multidrug efflux pump subunit AcrB